MADILTTNGAKVLAEAWAIATVQTASFYKSSLLATMSDEVFAGSEKGYHKAIIIQAAGKAADPSLDAQALQKGIGISNSWDAREFAKQVFVSWNRASGLPFSHAADPYVSNPYRIARFDKSVRGQRQKKFEFDRALAVLEEINTTTDEAIALDNLVEILLALSRSIAGQPVDYPLPARASLIETTRCIEEFTDVGSGGARLQAVVLALIESLSAQGMTYSDLRSRHVNASDASSGAAGDVSFDVAGIEHAVEVKDRPLDLEELHSTIEKCRVAGVRELLFVIRAGRMLAADLTHDDLLSEIANQFSSGLNIYIEKYSDFARLVLTIIGERGRQTFLESVGTALSGQNADRSHKVAWAKQVRSI